MSRDLQDRLRDAPIPDESGARERGWRVVRAAYGDRRPARQSARIPVRLAIAVGLAAVALALALTPAGAKVVDLVRDVVKPNAKQATPLTSLPAPGDLLVESPQGPWVVHRDGSQRLLGDYRQASWSPNGVFVAVTSEDQLSAVEPDGTVHWSINRPQPRDPRWVPGTGYRIAYRTGSSMRVVRGDGTRDHLLDSNVAPAAPAWRPAQLPQAKTGGGGRYVVALAKPDGRVEMVGADSRHVFWHSRRGPVPEVLDWSADSTWLVALSANELRVFSAYDGELLRTVHLPAGMHATDGGFAPTGKSFAVTATKRTKHGTRSEALIVPLGGAEPKPRVLLADPGTFSNLSWSPDGRWLLEAWRDADAWLFVRPQHPGHVRTAGDISQQFNPGSGPGGPAAFPRPAGWCCTPAGAG
jgi:hypothetical protein